MNHTERVEFNLSDKLEAIGNIQNSVIWLLKISIVKFLNVLSTDEALRIEIPYQFSVFNNG